MTVEEHFRAANKAARTHGLLWQYTRCREQSIVRMLLASANRHAGMAMRAPNITERLWYTAVEKAYRHQALEIAKREC